MEKSKRGTFIHGIACSSHLDSSGERIDIEGVDISSLTKDGAFNYEHDSKSPSSIVGKILEAKKIIKRSDCENDHHKYFWDKIKMPFIYCAGELLDGVGHKEASEVAAMVRYDQQEPINKDTKKLINFSIEGNRVEKQGAVITKCIARRVSITGTPCNKVCEAEELKIDPKEEKHSDSGDFKFIQDIMSKADEPSCQIMKGEIPFLYKAEITDKAPAAPIAAPTVPKKPKKPITTIARPNTGYGAIRDKTKKPKTGFGNVVLKGKKTPVIMTAEQAVDEHDKLVGVLESLSHKDDKKEAKKQRKELKEYKEKLNKGAKKIHPKDPVLGPKPAIKPASKEYIKQKQTLKKTEEIKTLKPCTSCNEPLTTANTRYEGIQRTHSQDYDLSLHTCHKCKSTIAVKIPKQKQPLGKSEKIDLKKPYVSDAQRRWAHTPKGKEALGGAKAVAHWDKESKGKNLPERKKKKNSKYDSNFRKALTTSCGVGASPAAKTQGEAVAKSSQPVGKTKSGKDIHPDFKSFRHGDWSREDHLDAHKMLHETGHKIKTEGHDNDDNMTINHGSNLISSANKHYEAAKTKITKSEIRKAMKVIGDQAFNSFEKKEELLTFLSQKLPNLSKKEIVALAKAVAYVHEKKKEIVLKSLMDRDDEK